MSTFIPPTPAATKSAEQHEEPSEQDSFNHLLYQVLRFTSEQVLGQDRSHATDQSQGQSQTSRDHDQANDLTLAKKMMALMTKQITNKQNVPTGMAPMSQPVGGWHVTSMTGRAKSTMSNHVLEDHADNSID